MGNTSKILIVDDMETNRELLFNMMKKLGYETMLAENGLSALSIINKVLPDIILLDIMMPEMDGFQVLEHLKGNNKFCHIPVIVISAIDDVESIVRCIERGADDYLIKPFNATMLQARLSASLEKKRLYDQEETYQRQIEEYNLHLEERVREEVKKVSNTQIAVIFAMAKLAESRDLETGEHLERIREYCKIIAEQLSQLPKYKSLIDKTFIENIYASSPLHDIGKVGVPDKILLKPNKLTEEEWLVMKTHTTIGAGTLRAVYKEYPDNEFIRMGIDIALSHHEKWDGSGYPKGLRVEKIPVAGRIVALADVYDALRSNRCYHKAISHEEAKLIINKEREKHFQPEIVDIFLSKDKQFFSIYQMFKDQVEESITSFDSH